MANQRGPARFTGRAGSRLPGRVRRALDAQVDTDRRLGEGLTVDRKTGRMDTALAPGGGLLATKQGLTVDQKSVGEMNRPAMNHIADVPSGATLADVIQKLNAVLFEQRRTGNMKGGY